MPSLLCVEWSFNWLIILCISESYSWYYAETSHPLALTATSPMLESKAVLNQKLLLVHLHECAWRAIARWLLCNNYIRSAQHKASELFSPNKILRWANSLFLSERAIAQLCRHTATSEGFQAFKRLCGIYTILNLECWKCARMKYHCANGLVVQLNCVP